MKTKGVIFDLDNTLINSESMQYYRDYGKWNVVFDNIKKYPVEPIIVKMINRLRARGVMVCVVSNSPESYCKRVLEHMGVEVDYIVGYHDTIEHKPDPEPVLLGVALMRHPEIVVGIGDQEADLIAYEKAGIKSVYVEYFSKYPTDRGCTTIKELLDVMKELLFDDE